MSVGSSLPFFLYAFLHSISTFYTGRFIANWGTDKPLRVWKVCHVVVFALLVFVILDCIRLGLGGFWGDTTKEDPPALAGLYALAVTTHLVGVPWFIWIQAELYIACKWKQVEAGAVAPQDTTVEKAVRYIGLAVSTVVTIILAPQLVGDFGLYMKDGYTREEEFGIVKYKWPHVEAPIIFDLFGVFLFAFTAVAVGGIIWCRTGWPVYFVTAFIGLAGQAVGPAMPDWFFFFMSNFFEVFSFAGMVIGFDYLFHLPENLKSPEALNDGGEMAWQGS